jgi:pyruvate decarboxylase
LITRAAAARFLHGAQKPVLVIGSKLRAAGAEKQAIEVAEALGCAVTVMAAAKSFFPEDHPQFAGIYWGEVSAPGTREIVDWTDAVVCIGTIFNDYSRVGWTAMPTGAGVLAADQNRVCLEGHDFGRIHLRDVLSGLARNVEKRDATMIEYKRIRVDLRPESAAKPDAKLVRAEIVRQIHPLLTADTTVIAETGDSWFNAIGLKLPPSAKIRPDDVAKALQPFLEVDEDLIAYLNAQKLKQKYWVGDFGDLILDRVWGEIGGADGQ